MGVALREAGSTARLTYVDDETGRTGDVPVRPDSYGRIGINAERVPVPSADPYPY
jgi:hypothetical protein